jgi:hypothetical protein
MTFLHQDQPDHRLASAFASSRGSDRETSVGAFELTQRPEQVEDEASAPASWCRSRR